jgi:conjugative relaxase-like TrwC/TraI family protein
MLSVTKLRVGQEAYQLSGVAESLDDYYTGAGEASGRWLGGGAERLDLTGEVDPAALRAVLAGLAPGSGGLTPNGEPLRAHPRRVPGFDLTFKVPKSVSVLYAVSDDPRVQGAIIDAGETAVAETLRWLEREAVRVQRGSHNQAWIERRRAELGDAATGIGPKRLVTSGLVAAGFRHRTSRAGDPLLHWHVLVANLAEGVDGKWSALAHPELYRHARAAGEVFQAVVRDELTRSLGVTWRPGRHVPEIAGIPEGLLRVFSKRRAEIDAWLAAHDTAGGWAGQERATLATRRSKPERESDRFDAAWKAEADAAGWGPADAERLLTLDRQRDNVEAGEVWRLPEVRFDLDGTPVVGDRVVDAEEWIADLLRRDLTAQASTFTRPQITQAVAARLGGGATVTTIERIVERVLASPQLLPVQPGSGDGRRWFTSRELHDVEARFIAALSRPVASPGPDQALAGAVVAARATLGVDQVAAVHALAGSAAAVSVLIGPAGTGKTFTLDTICHVFQTSGWQVVGAAPSARAALELTAAAGIEASTLHALAGQLARRDRQFSPDTLLVVDEAGMADVRTLEAVVTHAVGAGARVLLVGDHHQLPEVGAGGGFAYAAHHAATVAELSVNRRQHHPWEQHALAELRNGDVPAAVAAYLTHDRVDVAADTAEMLQAAVNQWFTARAQGLDPVLVAGTNDLVDRLNAAVIARLAATGALTAPPIRFAGGTFRVGERVVIRRNTPTHSSDGTRTRVANGQVGTICATTPDALTVRLDGGDAPVLLDQGFLARGGTLTHAYALTAHRAQGGTWDTAIAVGADGLYREGAYVALSRGRAGNRILLTSPEAAELERLANADLARHDTGLTPPEDRPRTVNEELLERLTQSRAKHLAHTVDPYHGRIDHLARTHTYQQLHQALTTAVHAAAAATNLVGADPDALARRQARADHTARHIAVGVRVKAFDRHNIGTVDTIDDRAGTATVRFCATDGRTAIRRFDWADLEILTPSPAPRPLSVPAADWLTATTAHLDGQRQRWDHHCRAHGAEPADVDRYQRALELHVQRHRADLAAEPPAWLTELLGPRPATPQGASTWDAGVDELSRWRLRQGYGAGVDGLGPRPDDPAGGAHWDRLQRRLADTRLWLAAHDDHRRPHWPAPRSRRELLDRADHLDHLFRTAPADQRDTIARLRAGQLTLDDASHALDAALSRQDERARWIVEHWPHVIEAVEISNALDQRTWGPDPNRLLNDIEHRPAAFHLTRAVARGESWIRPALCAIAHPDDTRLTDAALDWLERIATYRSRWKVSSPDPLGPDTVIGPQAIERDHLLDDLHAPATAPRQGSARPSTSPISAELDQLRRQLQQQASIRLDDGLSL